MPKVKFEDGTVINFDKQPTQADIEEAFSFSKRQTPKTMVPGERRGRVLTEPTVAQSVTRNLPEIAGATVGGILGAPLGPGGSIVGAGLGGAGVRGFRRAGQFVRGGGPGERFQIPPGAPRTTGRAALDVGIEGAIGAGAEVGGRLAFGALQKVVAPFVKKIIPHIAALKETFAKVGGKFSPAQQTESAILDIAENLAEGSFTGQGRMRAFRAVQEESLGKLEKKTAGAFAEDVTQRLSDVQVGELFLNTARKGRAAHAAVSNGLYSTVDELTAGAGVNVLGLKQTNQKIVADLARTRGIGVTADINKITKIISALPDTLPFSDTHAIRSELLKKVRDISNVPGEGNTRRIIGTLVDSINQSFTKAGTTLTLQANKAFRRADRFFKLGKEAFDNEFMAKLIVGNKKTPERIGETVFRSGNVQEIEQAKKAVRLASRLDKTVNFDETWKAMQSGFYQRLISESTDPSTGVIRGKKLLGNFVKFKQKRTLNAAFSPEQLKGIEDFARVADTIQTKSPGAGGMVMQLAQGGALAGLATGEFREASATVFITPFVLARLLTNPVGIRFLTQGLRIPAISARAFSLFGNIASHVAKEQAQKQSLNE